MGKYLPMGMVNADPIYKTRMEDLARVDRIVLNWL